VHLLSSKLSFSIILLIQIALLAQTVAATNSASVVESVTMGCFLEDQATAHDPNIKA